MFRFVCDPSSGTTELCLTKITLSGSHIFFVCLVGVWQRNFEPVFVCVCVHGTTGWDSPPNNLIRPWSTPRPGHFNSEKDLVLIVQDAGWTSGSVSTGAENLAATGIRSPDRPARNESLYRLSYRGPHCSVDLLGNVRSWKNFIFFRV